MGEEIGSHNQSSKRESRHRIRWHPVATHFPLALFGVTFGFQVLHFFFDPKCFFTTSNVLIMVGAIAMVPTLWTGWMDWKRNYRGARTRLFTRKIWIGSGMFVVSAAVAIFRNVYYGFHGEIPSLHHIWYTFALTLLIAGALTEGFYGGKLIRR